MTGEEVIAHFENGAVPANGFHHADHVRLAFEYLQRFGALEALDRFCAALKRFAAAQGKPGLYHETITWVYLLLIRERMARAGTPLSWQEFVRDNADLLVWKGGVLSSLYLPGTLESELARGTFVLPDRLVTFKKNEVENLRPKT